MSPLKFKEIEDVSINDYLKYRNLKKNQTN